MRKLISMIMKSMDNSAFYKLFIDTGGTFTDCIAIDPKGSEHRCKVLSSSAIRGVAGKTEFPDQLEIETGFPVKNNFYAGYKLILLNNPRKTYTIISSNAESSGVTLNQKLILPEKTARIPVEIRSPEEAPVLATRLITNTPLGERLPPLQMRLSTTKGTNSLLERNGGETLFLVTKGFGDLLKIRNQQRPDLFSLNIQKPEPFYSHVIEVAERLDAAGNVIQPPDTDTLRKQVEPLLGTIDSVAICLMHSYRNDQHEKVVEELLEELGVKRISRSSSLAPSIKIVPRAVTTDVNAFLAPVMESYLERISAIMKDNTLHVMTSAGTLAEAKQYRPKDGLLSGPAGGVIGAAAVAKRTASKDPQGLLQKKPENITDADHLNKRNLAGLEKETPQTKIISFDMGGTSTDVARYDQRIDYIFEHSVGDAVLSAPAVDIETVAAGGGSICGFDGHSLTVGPESAGADPGPACYGRGGPLTITDVNLITGRLHPSNFHITILAEAAEQKFSELMESMKKKRDFAADRSAILEGFLNIANERMAHAIRKISIQKGFDPAGYELVAFGGAGAQHALAVAKKLGIRKVLVPADAGLLSAYGLQIARLEEIASKQILQALSRAEPDLPLYFHQLAEEASVKLMAQGTPKNQMEINRRMIFMRFKGQDSALEIEWGETENLPDRFQEAYKKQYGHWIENREIEIESIRVIVKEKTRPEANDFIPKSGLKPALHSYNQPPVLPDVPGTSRPKTRIFERKSLSPGVKVTGPALILDPYSTTIIEPGWTGRMLEDGTWQIENHQETPDHSDKLEGRKTGKNTPKTVNLQLYTNRFRSVADQMGETLRKTSLSVNVKERLDYSCALLDRDGYLVVNAPHIPVHLGAMGSCVRALIQCCKLNQTNLEEGDILITNHPAYGGSHLPDVTVVTPVFYDDEQIGFVASRAHHAEIGGKRPGSMPPDAVNLAEEGVVIPPLYIARAGTFDWPAVTNLLKNSIWPTRSLDENLSDIEAAVAANYRGVTELRNLAALHGKKQITAYMKELRIYAAQRMRSVLQNIDDGTYSAADRMDDGTLLNVNCTVNGSSMMIDFSGTDGVHPGNLNANPSIVHSVVIYLLRLMVDEPLPLNDGLLEPIELVIPEGMLNPAFPDDPEQCPAVVGGNIETSQRLTDTLLKAFGLVACSYGTMNNVLFGNRHFGYYETVAGGTGAGNGFHGADAIHQHMTNTRATDPEILEYRYPVRLDRYAIRKDSGGTGTWSGGNGIIREMTFLEPVNLSVLAQHRVTPPYGLNGGDPGKTGRHFIEFKDGGRQNLKWRDGADLEPSDRFILHTPGGGGWGRKES